MSKRPQERAKVQMLRRLPEFAQAVQYTGTGESYREICKLAGECFDLESGSIVIGKQYCEPKDWVIKDGGKISVMTTLALFDEFEFVRSPGEMEAARR
jgi:hypothetical protein